MRSQTASSLLLRLTEESSVYLWLDLDVRVLVKALLLLSDGLLEALLEQRQLGDEVGDCVHQRLLLRAYFRFKFLNLKI